MRVPSRGQGPAREEQDGERRGVDLVSLRTREQHLTRVDLPPLLVLRMPRAIRKLQRHAELVVAQHRALVRVRAAWRDDQPEMEDAVEGARIRGGERHLVDLVQRARVALRHDGDAMRERVARPVAPRHAGPDHRRRRHAWGHLCETQMPVRRAQRAKPCCGPVVRYYRSLRRLRLLRGLRRAQTLLVRRLWVLRGPARAV